MSRAKFYKCVFDEHCKLTCNGEGVGGGGGWGHVTILVLIDVKHAIHLCARSEVLETDAVHYHYWHIVNMSQLPD